MEKEGYRFRDCEILRPVCDVAFKATFSKDEEMAMDLITSYIDFGKPVTTLEYINTELSPDMDGGRSCRLDVSMVLSDNTVVDVEVQTKRDLGIRRRSVAYAAKLLSSQLRTGKGILQPNVLSLFLLDHIMFPKEAGIWHRSYDLRDSLGRPFEKGVFQIDFVELPLAKELHAQGKPLFSKWTEFFTAESYAELMAVCACDPVLRRAQECLEMVSKDKQIWSDARARWEGEWTIEQRLIVATMEGEARTLQTAVQGMLNEGMTREVICRALRITPAEFDSLLKTIPS